MRSRPSPVIEFQRITQLLYERMSVSSNELSTMRLPQELHLASCHGRLNDKIGQLRFVSQHSQPGVCDLAIRRQPLQKVAQQLTHHALPGSGGAPPQALGFGRRVRVQRFAFFSSYETIEAYSCTVLGGTYYHLTPNNRSCQRDCSPTKRKATFVPRFRKPGQKCIISL